MTPAEIRDQVAALRNPHDFLSNGREYREGVQAGYEMCRRDVLGLMDGVGPAIIVGGKTCLPLWNEVCAAWNVVDANNYRARLSKSGLWVTGLPYLAAEFYDKESAIAFAKSIPSR